MKHPHLSPGRLKAARARQAEQRDRALALAAEWPHGVPSDVTGLGIVPLVQLEKEGLMRRLPNRDAMGALRFVLVEPKA
jgi:hypothetical protein